MEESLTDSSVQVHLRDCSTMKYQNSDFCANCYRNVVDNNRKFTDQLEIFRDGRWCQYGVTVGQALSKLFDVIRKSHLSPIILDEDVYTLCHNCFNLLSQLYVLFEEFTKISTPPSFCSSFIRSSRFFDPALLAEVKSEPPDDYMEHDYDKIHEFDDYHVLDDGIDNNESAELFGNSSIVDDVIVLNDSGNEDNQLDDDHIIQPKNCVEAVYCPDEEGTGTESLSHEGLKKKRLRSTKTAKKVEDDEEEVDDEEVTLVNSRRKPRRRTHICTECNMGFTRSNHLRRHALLHSAKEFTCECGVGFRAQRNLQYHLKYNCPKNETLEKKKSNHHRLENPQLDKSAKIKQAAKLVRIAKKSHKVASSKGTSRRNEPRVLVCSLIACGKVFSSKYKLGRHEAIHLVKPFICEHCHKSYRTEDILSNHIRLTCRVFNNLPQASKATTSTKTTKIKEKEIDGAADEDGENTTIELLPRPGQKKRSNNTKRYTCHCGASFSRTNHLHDHSLVHREANVVCDQCNAGFISQEKLDKHQKVVHDPNYRKPTNTQVKKVSTSTEKVVAVKIKKKVRDSNAKEDCKVCGKAIRARNMRIHLSTHSELRPAVCELCGLSFKLYWSLKCHQKYAHGDNRPFLCRFCGAAFKRNQHLLDHEVVKHSDVRLYVCDEPGCDKSFKSSRNLRQHRHLHAGVKFPCPECGKIFSRKDNLKVHRDKSCHPVHGENVTMGSNDRGLVVGFEGQSQQPTVDTIGASADSDTSIVVDDTTSILQSKGGGHKNRQLGFIPRFYDRPKQNENPHLNSLLTKLNGSAMASSSSSSTKVIQSKGTHRHEHKTKASSTSQAIVFNSQMASAAITASHFLYSQPPNNIIINNDSSSQPSYLQTSSSPFLLPTSTSATNSVCNTTATNSGLTNPVMFDLDNFGKL